jgi:hypothetical protein
MILLLCLIVALILIIAQGCEEEDIVRPDQNRPPETVLSVAPGVGDRVFHRYLVRWAGLDRDGVVTEYEVATVAEEEIFGGYTGEDTIQYLLDLDWERTDETERLFVFRADRPNSRNHSIYIRAIDNEGKADPSPARTNFMAIDFGLPEIEIQMTSNLPEEYTKLHRDRLKVPVPEGDTLPVYNLENPGEPILIKAFWKGFDPDSGWAGAGGGIVEWKYRLDSAVEVTLPVEMDSVVLAYYEDEFGLSDVWVGFHELRLAGVDDANARGQEAVARFVINYDPQTVIDSIWTFRRDTEKNDHVQIPGPDSLKLIYAKDWPDTMEVDRTGYHFGQLIMKFHATDRDGPTPESFKWGIRRTLLNSDWISKQCGQSGDTTFYCDTTFFEPFLYADNTAYELTVRARDDYQKADGSPAMLAIEVNVAPKIVEGSISHEVDPQTGKVKFTWDAYDPDEGYGWGVMTGEAEQALMKYRYRIDGGQWEEVSRTTRNPRRFYKEAEIEGISPGVWHVFELFAFNGTNIQTRTDRATYRFKFDL